MDSTETLRVLGYYRVGKSELYKAYRNIIDHHVIVVQNNNFDTFKIILLTYEYLDDTDYCIKTFRNLYCDVKKLDNIRFANYVIDKIKYIPKDTLFLQFNLGNTWAYSRYSHEFSCFEICDSTDFDKTYTFHRIFTHLFKHINNLDKVDYKIEDESEIDDFSYYDDDNYDDYDDDDYDDNYNDNI